MTARSIDLALMPAADESPRCAVHAETIGLDPGGSALFVDEFVVVDVPLPWPKPVWDLEGFTDVPELVARAADAGRRVRVLAAVPAPDAESGMARVTAFRRRAGHGSMTREEHRVPSADAAVLVTILVGDGLDASPATRVAASDGPTVLICTQGSHDICCGSRGTALVMELMDARPDLDVRRVSHTGGHRFAPTAVTLPDARMWGHLDLASLVAVVDRHAGPAAVASMCRGWTGASEPAQVAERAVWSLLDDWTFDDRDRSVSVVDGGDGSWQCEVVAGPDRWVVEVGLGRDVPTIACGEPGGAPAKPGREYVVRSGPRVVS